MEGNGRTNRDVWSIVRQTTNGTGDSGLQFVFGQNNQHNNPNIVTYTPNGRVEVGTESPTHKHEVNGNGKWDNSVSSDNFLIFKNPFNNTKSTFYPPAP